MKETQESHKAIAIHCFHWPATQVNRLLGKQLNLAVQGGFFSNIHHQNFYSRNSKSTNLCSYAE